VRLLQNFSEFAVDWKTQPESSKTPARWIPTKEPMNIGYDVGLTMSVKVCSTRELVSVSLLIMPDHFLLGSTLG